MIRPMTDMIIVKRSTDGYKSPSGLVIPQVEGQEPPCRGVVVAVGDGRVLEDGSLMPLEVTTGDEIVFGKFVGIECKIDGEDYLVLKEEDVLAVVGGNNGGV